MMSYTEKPGLRRQSHCPRVTCSLVEESDMQFDTRKKMLEAKSTVMCSTDTEQRVISSACEFRENSWREAMPEE